MGFLGRLGEPSQVCVDHVFPAGQGICVSSFLRGTVSSSPPICYYLEVVHEMSLMIFISTLTEKDFKLYKGDPLSIKSVFSKLYSNFHIAKTATEDMVKVVNNLCNSSLCNLTRQVETSENLPTQSKCVHSKQKGGNENLPNTNRGGIWGSGIMFMVVCFIFLNFLNFYVMDVYVQVSVYILSFYLPKNMSKCLF